MSQLISVKIPPQVINCQNFVSGKFVKGSGERVAVASPYNGKVIGEFYASTQADVDSAAKEAKAAQKLWADVPMKERTKVMLDRKSVV